ncbi:MAG: diacylglycerol kinase family protein [Blautia sp.]|nr:diacylglycerol kinase family protein [Blautia sp.]
MKYHFIVNSKASSGKGRKIWKQVHRILEEENADYLAYFPKSKRETVALVRKLTSQGDCHLVVVGGDGTLNLVLQGIRSFEHTRLSCIRAGSGNDFAKNMNLEKDLQKSLSHLLHHPEERILDYGVETLFPADDDHKEPLKRRFLISSGVGYDADICYEASKSRLKTALNHLNLGKAVYFLIGMKLIFTKKCSKAVLKVDDQNPQLIPELFFLTGMIHPCEGGGFAFCPDASCTDGMLDLCLVESMSKSKLMLAVCLVFFRRHNLLKKIHGFQCRKMTLILDNPQCFHHDGDTPFWIRRVDMECKKGLRFVE